MNTRKTDISKRSTRSRDGSVLVTVVVLAAAMLASGAVLLTMAHRTAYFSYKMKKDTSAIYDAEAGISMMLDIMSENRDDYLYWSANRTLVTNFNEAMLTVTTETRTNMTSGVMTTRITSTAAFDEESRTTIIEAAWVPVWFYQILAAGTITVQSAAPTIYGDIHSNSNIVRQGGAAPTIYGNISSSGPICDVPPEAGYTASANTPVVDMSGYDARPSFPDWKSMAQSGGIYEPGDVEWDNDVLNPGNGVVYVDGNVTMRRGCTVVATVVVAGNVDISQQFDQTAPAGDPPTWWTDTYAEQYGSNWPSLLVGGNLTERNNNDWEYPGAFFAAGSIELRNNRTFAGSLVSLETVSIKNNVTINNQGFAMTNAIDLTMGAWLK